MADRGPPKRAIAALLCLALLATGCFGYNKSAKRWSYVGDPCSCSRGGGGAIAADLLTKKPACMETATLKCDVPAAGLAARMVAGRAARSAAGLCSAIIFNATRDEREDLALSPR